MTQPRQGRPTGNIGKFSTGWPDVVVPNGRAGFVHGKRLFGWVRFFDPEHGWRWVWSESRREAQ